MKQLSNEQRVRLEQITHNEFSIRKNELTNAKNKEYTDWIAQEQKKMADSLLFKTYLKINTELERVKKQIKKRGFNVAMVNGRLGITINTNGTYSINGTDMSTVHPKCKEMLKKTYINQNDFTRGLNEVLAVIWSMEKPFSECLSLIKAKIKTIK
jgi:hypothetical protein